MVVSGLQGKGGRGAEQLGIPVLVSEWALLVHRPWFRIQEQCLACSDGGLAEVPETVNSGSIHDHICIKSPRFQTARRVSDFAIWGNKGN